MDSLFVKHTGNPLIKIYEEAVAAYLRLEQLPRTAPFFNFDLDNEVEVYGPERLCRMPGKKEKHCGLKFSSREHLLRHLEEDHDARQDNSLFDRVLSNPNLAGQFFHGWVYDEDDDEKLPLKQEMRKDGNDNESFGGAEDSVVPEHGSLPRALAAESQDGRSGTPEATTLASTSAEMEAIVMELAEVTMQEKLEMTRLRKIQLERKLAAVKRRDMA